MASVTAFFTAHDEAERYMHTRNGESEPLPSVSGADSAPEHVGLQLSAGPTAGSAPECNFAAMARLPEHWNHWTGNNSPSEDMAPFLCTNVSRNAFARETIRIPFKPSVWQRGSHRPKHHHDSHAPEVAGGEGAEHEYPHSGRDSPTSASPAREGAQLAYGALRLFDTPVGSYWSSFSLTECLMASPWYQHLSSEKFRALEHFAVLRRFQDQETIVMCQQRFFNIYYIRYVRAIKTV
jgi:hypothetical protein